MNRFYREIFMLVAVCILGTASPGLAAGKLQLPPGIPAEEILILTLPAGNIVIHLLPRIAPKHVSRIKQLTRQKFYDGVAFHRVIPDFMAQTGDPTGTGRGGSPLPDLPPEFSSLPFERGTLGMARSSSPSSANSQFFICFKRSTWLTGQYTVFAQVLTGMEFVDALAVGEPPLRPDRIIRARIAADL